MSEDIGGGEPATSSQPAGDAGSSVQNTQDAAPDTGASSQGEGQSGQQDTSTGSQFEVPEAYREKSWAEHIKSPDDLWKKADNLQSLVGKKTVAPDFDNATPEEIGEYFNQVRPETPEDYTFNTSDDYVETGLEPQFGKLLHDNGISKYQGDKLIAEYQKMVDAQRADMFSPDGFMESMEQHFGNGYEKKVDQTRQLIEGNLTESQKQILDNTPNEYLGLIYQLTGNMAEQYGVFESGKAGEHKGGFQPKPDVKEVRAGIRKELNELTKSPHTVEQKQELINKLNATYTNG